MGKHKGQKDSDWTKAVKSAADQVVADGAPEGNYTLETEFVPKQQAGAAPARPIRDYIVTLDGPH